jgi:hypothetical protein
MTKHMSNTYHMMELRVRVVARDARTNRQALLWESGKAHKLGVMDPSPYWQVG